MRASMHHSYRFADIAGMGSFEEGNGGEKSYVEDASGEGSRGFVRLLCLVTGEGLRKLLILILALY